MTPRGSGWEGHGVMSLVRRYPLSAFFVLAVALSWWAWILYAVDLSPSPIVGLGPFLAALIVPAVTEGKRGVMGLLTDGALARRAAMVCRGAPASRCSHLTAAALNVYLLGAQRTSTAADLGGWSS